MFVFVAEGQGHTEIAQVLVNKGTKVNTADKVCCCVCVCVCVLKHIVVFVYVHGYMNEHS